MKSSLENIGRLKVRTFSNGDVLIAEPRINFSWCFLFLLIALGCGITSLLTGKTLEFPFAVISIAAFIMAGILFRAWLRPGSIYVSNHFRHLRVKTEEGKSVLEWEEIQEVRCASTANDSEVVVVLKDKSSKPLVGVLSREEAALIQKHITNALGSATGSA